MEPIILKKDQILSLLDFNEVIDAVEKSFVAFAKGDATIPPPQDIIFPEHNGEADIKSAAIKGYDSYCVKIVSAFFDNPKKGLSSLQGLMVLMDTKIGSPKAILLDGGELTHYRTAAAGAIAAKYIARPESNTVLIVGTGTQAKLQAKFLSQVFKLKNINIWGRSEENLRNFISEMANELPGVSLNGDTKLEKIINSKPDIIVTTTPSRIPLIKSEWIQNGTHINAIGSDIPEKQELDVELMARARVVTDSTEQCSVRGELHHAIEKKTLSKKDVCAELGQVILDKNLGRTNSNDITIFDSTGLGIQDLAIAEYVFRKASRRI